MLFNSIAFALFFLPLTLILFYSVPHKLKLYVLFAASLIFYASSGLVPFYFMVAGILWIYVFARLGPLHDRMAIVLGVSFPLFTLIMFRYLGFILDTLRAPDPLREPFFFFLSVALPAGISFYTFQMMCYVVDARRRNVELPSFLILSNYISFFPQLIAGPILRIEDVHHQFQRVSEGDLRPDFRTGMRLIAFGLAGKVFLADFIAVRLQFYQGGETVSLLDTTFVILAYSFRIYLDFWAYSTMAVGLGKLFSINLPRNFLEPYFSYTPREFWRRWHVTLSFWLRDYVYIPLGGNERYIRNIMIVFATCGLWHGAGWNFVAWGIYHGALVAGYKLVSRYWDAVPKIGQRALTFGLISLAWPLFFLDIEAYFQFMKGFYAPPSVAPALFGAFDWVLLTLVGVFVFGQREENWLYPEEPTSAGWIQRLLARAAQSTVVQGVLIAVSIAFFELSTTFIYFRF
jgi:alginate O-acetyltransferase complex protein AlgI